MLKAFSDPDEPIMFSSKVNKLSRWNLQQTRVLVQTATHIYLFNNGKLNRKHRITNIAAFIKSSVSTEFVLHFPKGKDLRVVGLGADEVEQLLNQI